MKITINGTPHVLEGSVEDALKTTGLTGRVATALNGTFLPAGLRATTILTDGDAIEVVAPMQGG